MAPNELFVDYGSQSWSMNIIWVIRPHAIDFLFRVRTLLIFGLKNKFSHTSFSHIARRRRKISRVLGDILPISSLKSAYCGVQPWRTVIFLPPKRRRHFLGTFQRLTLEKKRSEDLQMRILSEGGCAKSGVRNSMCELTTYFWRVDRTRNKKSIACGLMDHNRWLWIIIVDYGS